MATETSHEAANAGRGSEGATGAVPEDDRWSMGPDLASEQVWRAIAKASFAVLSYVTPSGSPDRAGSSTRP